jgi:putative ABC transport system substrate-binding protein
VKPAVEALCVGAIAVSVLAMASIACAQPASKAPEKSYRIAVLSQGNPPTNEVPGADLRQGLRDWGYIDGRNVAVDFRYGAGKAERLPELADEIVRMKVDVIVTVGDSAALAAKRATASIPIVATEFGLDPVKSGLVSSLGRPDGNVTGLSSISDELWSKRLDIIRQVAPKMTRLAVVWNSTNPGNAACLAEIRTAGRSMGAEVQPIDVVDANAAERAFATMSRERPDVLAMCWDSVTLEYAHAIADFATKRRIPTIAPLREYAKAGALLSFGVNLPAHRRRAAYYTDKIIKGAKPADLPLERPTTFELVVNIVTAKALGVALPPAVALVVDEVIPQEAR